MPRRRGHRPQRGLGLEGHERNGYQVATAAVTCRECPRPTALRPTSVAPQPGRQFSSSAVLASLALVGSFAALGLNSISISRIEGANGAGLIALSTQFIFLATFVAGAGLRTSVTYRVGAGLWSPRSAVSGVLTAALWLGLVGAVLGLVAYALLRGGAMSEFSPGMAIALMSALPFALAWWIVPRDSPGARGVRGVRVAHRLLTGRCVGAVSVARRSRRPDRCRDWLRRRVDRRRRDRGGLGDPVFEAARSGGGPRPRRAEAGGFGARAWVNDLFQLINLRPDLFILSAYYGTADTGVYAVTVSITSLVWIVSQPLASVVLPGPRW